MSRLLAILLLLSAVYLAVPAPTWANDSPATTVTCEDGKDGCTAGPASLFLTKALIKAGTQNAGWSSGEVKVGICGTTIADADEAVSDAFRRTPQGMSAVYPGFTKRLVSCMKAITRGVADSYLGPLQTVFSAFGYGMIVIYITVFGIKVATGGVRSIKSDMVVVILTVALVSYAVRGNGLNTYFGYFVDVQEALVGVVMGTINDAHNVTTTTGEGSGEITTIQTGLCNDYRDAWQKLDCTLAFYMGANPDTFAGRPGGMAVAPFSAYDEGNNTGPDDAISLVPLLLISGTLFTEYGIVLFLLGIGFILLLIVAVAQAVIVYVGALLVITFLSIVGYIVIPMALFQQTRQIFDGWLQLMIAYTLQPAIVMGYLAFMVHVLDIAFNPSNGDTMGLDGMTPMSVLYEQFYTKEDQQCRMLYQEMINATVSVQGDKDAQNTSDCTTVETSETGQNRFAVQSKDLVILDRKISCEGMQDMLGGSPQQMCKTDWPKALKDAKKRGLNAFMQNMIIVTLLMLITFTFMANVLAFGATLAGITAAPVNASLNFYNKAMAKMTVPKK